MKTRIALFLFASAACATAGEEFQVASSAFGEGRPIPAECSRQGGNTPPPLAIANAPLGTRSLALVVDDPDAPAGVWTHWLVANLSPGAGVFCGATAGAVVGTNSWNAARYDGPQPPAGVHRYVFRVFALDERLPLAKGFTRADLDAAMKGHVLARAQLVGTFAK